MLSLFFVGFVSAKTTLSRSAIVRDNVVEQQQEYENVNGLALWHERIANIYADVNELQFMNYGYADFDDHIDGSTDYYSRKLYDQVSEKE